MAIRISGGGGSRGGKSTGRLGKGGALSGITKANSNQIRNDLTQNRFQPARSTGKSVPKSTARSSSGTSRNSGSRSSSYSGGPTGGSFSAMSAPSDLAVTPTVPSEEDYLAGDATYNATISALAKQLQSFQTDLDTQRNNRKLDYDKAIKDLGYVGPDQWNWDDTLTASGRSYQNLVNDAASRGTLQSSGYADSLNDLTRSLMDQYTGINDSNTQFNADLDRQLTKAKDENTSASQAARAEAIMRRAAQYGFGV